MAEAVEEDDEERGKGRAEGREGKDTESVAHRSLE